MSDFKVGDNIIIKDGCYSGSLTAGRCGTVSNVSENLIWIEYDDGSFDMAYSDEIELISNKRVGKPKLAVRRKPHGLGMKSL